MGHLTIHPPSNHKYFEHHGHKNRSLEILLVTLLHCQDGPLIPAFLILLLT